MNFTTYILLGVLFTFILESLSTSDFLKDHIKSKISFGFLERLASIFLWPILLGIFLYNFIKTYLNL